MSLHFVVMQQTAFLNEARFTVSVMYLSKAARFIDILQHQEMDEMYSAFLYETKKQ